jgi:S1-C subfamily serine protease
MVINVENNSPAAKAGLLNGDIIISFNDKIISGIDDLHKVLTEDHLGITSKLKVLRYTDLIELEITPVERIA